MTSTNTLAPKGVDALTAGLNRGDVIHIQPHEAFRHGRDYDPVPVECSDADVRVDCLIFVGSVVVICWRACTCTSVCGAVVYDADDYVERLQVAA